MNKTEPNLIIFRLPDENGIKTFVELPYLDSKLHATGSTFSIEVEDGSYNSMDFNHIILARTTAEGSLDLAKFDIFGKNDEPAAISEINYTELKQIVSMLLKQYHENKSE